MDKCARISNLEPRITKMETIHIIPDHTLHALGWTVVHSLWQGFLIALILGIFLYRNPSSDARKRYLAGFVSLGGILLASVITFFTVLDHPETGLAFFAEGSEPLLFEFGENAPLTFTESLNENMPLIVLIWLVGMVVFLLKMMGGLLYVQRLKHHQLSAVPAKWEAVLESLQTRIGMNAAVRLSASALVKVPMVVGWLKPVILLPIGAVNQLTPAQVEAILAHELAHIARYDYVLNLVQSFIEMIFYFNPAVWWISSIIRTERENCCDDLAVKLCGNPFDYARALVSLQEMHHASPAFALSFASGKNQLLNRIRRILKQPHKNSNAMEKFSIIGLTLAAAILLSMQASADFPAPPGAQFYEISNQEMEPEEVPLDTLPKGTVHWQRHTDDEQVEIKIEDGEVIYLKIDGEEIPEEDYGDYESEIVDMLENVPPLPPPPHFNENEFGVPEPPAPPAPPSSFSSKIITERDGKNTIIIIEDGMGAEPIEIEVEHGRRGNVIINGEAIEGIDLNDEDVILREIERGGVNLPLRLEDEIHFSDSYLLLDRMGGENVFVFPEIEEGEIDGIIAEAMGKHEALLEEVKVLRLEGMGMPHLLELSETGEIRSYMDSEDWEELSEEQREDLEREKESIQKLLEEVQMEHLNLLEELEKIQLMEERKIHRKFRRSDGAM